MDIGSWVKQITKAQGSSAPDGAGGASAEPPPHRDVAEATAQPAAVPEAGTRWRAFIDRVTISSIEGWALDTQNPRQHVAVEAVTSKGKSVVALAHLYREDVAQAGYGDGHCGFFIDLSRLSLQGESAIVRFVGSKHPITDEPIEFDPGRAVFTTDMPPTYKALMELLAAETLQASEADARK